MLPNTIHSTLVWWGNRDSFFPKLDNKQKFNLSVCNSNSPFTTIWTTLYNVLWGKIFLQNYLCKIAQPTFSVKKSRLSNVLLQIITKYNKIKAFLSLPSSIHLPHPFTYFLSLESTHTAWSYCYLICLLSYNHTVMSYKVLLLLISKSPCVMSTYKTILIAPYNWLRMEMTCVTSRLRQWKTPVFFFSLHWGLWKQCAEMAEPTDQSGLECFVIAWRRVATEIHLDATWTLHKQNTLWLCWAPEVELYVNTTESSNLS